MNNKFILMLLALFTIALLSACDTKETSTKNESNEIIEQVEEEVDSEYMTETGGVKIGKDGAIKRGEYLDVPVNVDFFFDPVCLSCAQYNDAIGLLIENKITQEEIGVTFHPVPYLNDQTPDDYSNRASAYILSVAEYAPDKVLKFIQTVLSVDFIPENPADENTSDQRFIEAMEDAGLTDDEIEKVEFNKDSFVSIAIAAGKEFSSENSRWIEFSPIENDEGQKVIFTPFILINENGEHKNEALSLEKDLVKEFEDAISNVIE